MKTPVVVLLSDALKFICTANDSGVWIDVYREAGGGYEGLQAVAAAALDATAEERNDPRQYRLSDAAKLREFAEKANSLKKALDGYYRTHNYTRLDTGAEVTCDCRLCQRARISVAGAVREVFHR